MSFTMFIGLCLYWQKNLTIFSLNSIKTAIFIKTRNTGALYYDCTNYYFEIEDDDDFRKYGKSKENRPNPVVGMGLMMDGDGIPLAFDLYEGNRNEQTTLKPLEERIIKGF